MVAIIPAGGKGTRMLSVTGGSPKELLKLGRRTVLERIIAEARECDPDRIVVVSAPTKPALSLAATEMGVEVELQVHPLGLADAIATAGIEDDAVILLGDCAYFEGSPAPRMSELVRKGIDGCIAVEEVDDAGTDLYGIVDVDEMTGAIRDIFEKPGPKATSSRWAVAARFSFGARLMSFLTEYVRRHRSPDSELGLTEVLKAAIVGGFDLKGVPLQPGQKRVDCGTPQEYSAARQLNW